MPLTYRQVKDVYDVLKQTGATSLSLPEWAGNMNDITGTNVYDEGLHDNFIKRSSVAIDRTLEASGLSGLGEDLGGVVGSVFGMEKQGRDIGHGLPRMAVNFLPAIGAEIATGGGATPFLLGALGTGALSGAETYTATGSPAAGVVSGAVNALLPTGVGKVEQSALSFLRNRGLKAGVDETFLPRLSQGLETVAKDAEGFPTATKARRELFSRSIGQFAAATASGQLAAAGIMGTSDIAQQALSGQDIQNPFSKDFLLSLGLSQLPFTALHLGAKVIGRAGPSPMARADSLDAAFAQTERLLALKKAKEDLATQTPIEKIPILENQIEAPDVKASTDAALVKLGLVRDAQNRIVAKPAPTADDLEELNRLVQEDFKSSGKAPLTNTTVLGSEQPADADKIGLIGRDVTTPETKARGKSRSILVADDPSNPDEFRGRVVNYSKGTKETPPQETSVKGMQIFAVPTNWHTILPLREQTKPTEVKGKSDPSQLTLPDQANPAPSLFDHITALDKVEATIDAATTPAEVQKAVAQLRLIEESGGLSEFSDKQWQRVAKKYEAKSNPNPVRTAVKSRLARDKRLLTVQQERQTEVQTADSWRADMEAEHAKGEAGDPVTVGLMNNFNAYEKDLAGKGGRRAMLVDSGELGRLFYSVRNDPDPLGKLNQLVSDAISTGKGIPRKARPVLDEVKAKVEPTVEAPAPIRNIVAESAYRATENLAGAKAFDSWPQRDTTTWDFEKNLFRDWADEFGTIDAKDIPDAAEYFADRDGLNLVDVRSELEDFVKRPHVKVWLDTMEASLAEAKAQNEGPKAMAPREMESAKLAAGGGFIWGLANYDPITHKLGDKYTLPKKSDELTAKQFQEWAGRGKPLNKAEVETAKLLVPEAFDERGNVNVRKLYELLPERKPVTSVTYGQEGKPSEAKAELDKMTHEWLETLPPGRQDLVKGYAHGMYGESNITYPEIDLVKARQFKELYQKVKAEPLDTSPRATSYYNQISPFDTKKFPVTRVDVALPRKIEDPAIAEHLKRIGVAPADWHLEPVLWPPDNLHENLPNTLGWAMVQFVPDPKTGETVAFVGEQQSRWGQEISKFQREGKDMAHAYAQLPDESPEQAQARYIKEKSHPLLPLQHALVLKAVIAEAAKRGVNKVVLSDSKTALMTELLDTKRSIIKKFKSEEEAKAAIEANPKTAYPNIEREGSDWIVRALWSNEEQLTQLRKDGFHVDQEKGFDLHYDTTLTSAMKKLTGNEGEAWESGVHKNAIDERKVEGQQFREWQQELENGNVTPEQFQQHVDKLNVGSPVFRNPDGTPKSSVTGRIYDISEAIAKQQEQGGAFTLGDPSRAPAESESAAPWEPATQKGLTTAQAITGSGTHLLEEMTNSDIELHSTIAKTLLQLYPDALSLIDAHVLDVGGSYTAPGLDRRAHIALDPGLLTASPAVRENVVLHEVIHGLTIHELASPTANPAIVARMNDLRERLVAALPKKLREYYNDAISSGWLERNAADPTRKVWMELGPTVEARQILYGLMNNHELAAQGFSSKAFQDFMRSVPGEGKKTSWRVFSDWVKELVGLGPKIDGTAFEEWLGTTRQLMHSGEFLATLQKYGQRYYEDKGESSSYARAQTERAMGLVAESAQGLTRTELFGSLASSEGPHNPELESARKNLEGFLGEEPGDEHMAFASVLGELGHEATVEGLDDFVLTSLGEGRSMQDALDLLPPAATRYIYAKVNDHADVIGMLGQATKADMKGVVNIENPEGLRRVLAAGTKATQVFVSAQARQREFATALVGLAAVEPSGFLDRQGAPKEDLSDFIEGAKTSTSGVGHWIKNFLQPFGQLVREIPEAAEIGAKAFQLQSNVRRMFNEAVKPFGVDVLNPYVTPEPTHESVTESVKVLQNPKLLDATNRWIYWNQKRGNDKVTMLSETDSDVAKVLAGLSQTEREAVHAVVAKQGKSTQVLNAQKVEKMKEIASVYGAGVLGSYIGGKTKDNVALASELLDAVVKVNDPMIAWTAQAQMQSVMQRMPPEAFSDLLKFTQGEAEKILSWQKYFDANPFWATAQTMERYWFRYMKNGKPFRNQASSMKEVKEIIAKKGGSLIEVKDLWKGRDDEPFAFPNMGPDTAARMQQIEENQIAMLKSRGVLDSNEVEEFRRTSAVTQILREASAEQSIPGVKAPPRLLSQGAEELPFLWNHISNAQRETNYWSRALLRAQMRTYLRDPEISANEQLRQQLQTHFENLLHPDPQLAQQTRRFMTTWFLGFNLATCMINASQPFLTHVSELTAMSGKPIDSYHRVLRSLSELSGRFIEKKEWASVEHEKFMNDAVKDGEIGLGMFDDEAAAQESIATNYKRAMMKQKPETLGQRLGDWGNAYSTAGMWLFQHGERLNSRSALLSGFDYYREQGLNYDDAKAKAYEFNRAVNYSGGRAQRPIGAFSGRGAFPRSVAMMGTALQSYVLGTTFQIARYLQKGFFRPEGLTPHEVWAARKAGVQMLATQFAAAGLLGMPFVSGAVALLNNLFPSLELNKHLHEGIGSFFGTDEGNGNVMSDIAMTGVPSLLGWDMQSRLSMGNTLPGVSEVNGFQPENLMGPAANIVKNFVGGATGWVKGDAKAGLKFMPPAIEKAIDTAHSFLADGGAIRDYQGQPLASPTLAEHLGRAIGFQPKRLSDQNAAGRILKQADEQARDRVGQFHQGLAESVLKGDFGTARQAIIQRSRDDKSYNSLDGVRAVARAAEELYFPRDLRREGQAATASGRNSVLSSYMNLSASGSPSEVARLQFRSAIEQKLGLQSNPGPELRLAQLMDQLKAKQPQATRSQLRAEATAMLRRSEPRALAEVE